ncbi:unnamed protein product [Heterobilharzia americana]|nr:unnamed protein product [Heterobilharzia americana]
MISLIVVDWTELCSKQWGAVRRGGYAGWTAEKNLEYLDFASDDLCLMSHKLEDLQVKTDKLSEEAGQRRRDFLQVNIEKTEVMKIPHQQLQQQQQTAVTINGRNLKQVTSFTYLGRTVSTTGGTGTDEDVKVRIGKARQAFNNLKPVWRSSELHSA